MENLQHRHTRQWFTAGIALLLAIVAQLLFGHLGFNPTDNGYVLAMSRRLLDGQIPHKDFISIRPVLSPLIHVPEVAFFGAKTFYFSRLIGWIFFGIISFCWTRLLLRNHPGLLSRLNVIFITVIIFCLCSFTFPVMAWHTIDALTLASVGMVLISSPKPWRLITGFLLLGLTGLCKQNFLVLPVAAWIIFYPRKFKFLLITFIPPIIYVLLMLYWQAWPAFIQQIFTETALWQIGFASYLFNPFFWLGMISGGLILFFWIRKKIRFKPSYYAIISSLLILLMIAMIWNKFAMKPAFFLFGILTGMTLVSFIIQDLATTSWKKIMLMLLVLAWAVSISIGMNTPVMASGILAVAIILFPLNAFPEEGLPKFITIPLIVIVLAGWYIARNRIIYRDLPASQETYSLTGIFPGADLLQTNKETYSELKDLREVLSEYKGRTIAVIPEHPALWVQFPQPNPLPIDWAAGIELNSPALLHRVEDSLKSLPENGIVVVQKYQAATLPFHKLKISAKPNHYAVAIFVRKHFKKIRETAYFEIYKPG